ncbi:MAG: DUF1588 domain-containing protein [Myxococcales bacterium]
MRCRLPLLLCCSLAACSASGPEEQPAAHASTRAAQLLAPSLRRLSVAELSAAASSLVGKDVDLAKALPADARQHDFSRSLTQSVDALTLKQLVAATRDVAERLELTSPTLPACARDALADDQACQAQLLTSLATEAFRRAPNEGELSSLHAIFEIGAAGASFRDGAVLVVRALLGSPELLYETALGLTTDGARVSLNGDELASQLSWLVGGAPPDAELRRAASEGELRLGPERRRQALRLLQNSAARSLYRRFVEEWLGLTRLRSLAKASSVAPDFMELREPMLHETESVIDDAFVTTGGAFQQLFAGGYSIVPSELSGLYGIAATGADQRVSLGKLGRVGLLQQASFLATFAHEDESAPVLRGKAVLERLLCRQLPKPGELGIELVLPPPNPDATTRERFALHAQQPRCAACHELLDGVGFTFENFDAVGRGRASEAGKPVDTTGHLLLDGQDLPLRDSAELSLALAGSQELAECAARQVVRFAAGLDATAVEDDFVRATRSLAEPERGSIVGLFLAFVEGDWFAWRARP